MADYRYGSGGGGVGRLTAQKSAAQASKKKSSPGVLSRVMDVLSRGQYASAGLALGKGPKESLSMALKGVQGKGKYSYADVLSQRLGVRGKPAALAGFGLDIALDPTTYLGVGLGKAGAQAVGKGLGRVVEKTIAEEVAENVAEGVAKTVVKKGGSTLYKPGATLWKGAEGAQGAVRAGETAAGRSVGAAAKGLAGGPTGRALELKFLGKPIVRSERAYNVSRKALGPVANSKAVDLLGRTFRTGHGLPEGIRNLERKSHGLALQDLHDTLLDVRKTFSGTTKAQRREIGAAISRGTVDSLDESLRPLAEYAQKHLDDINPREGLSAKSSKLFDDEPFKVAEDAADQLPSKADDIADTLAKAYDKHYTKRAYTDFRKAVDDKFSDISKDPEIRRALDRTEKVFLPGSPEGREWTRLFDRVQGYWKLAVTAPNPGFHIRNVMGDTYLNYLDGVVNPNVYRQAAGVLRKDGTIRLRAAGRELTGEDVMRLYREQGLHSKFSQTENLVGGTGSKVLNKIGDASNVREDFTRIAHFMDALGKEARHGRSFDDAVDAAAARVRKFNIDYSDLTDMEKKFKRVMPFYTFVRKALPTQLEMTFTRPGRIAALPKGKQAMERLLGSRQEGDQSPLPGIDENLPPWMRDYFNISAGNNRIYSPDLPIDLLGEYANPVKGVVGGLSPFIAGPVELGTGKTLPYGINQREGIPRYILNQVPLGRQLGNIATQDEDAGEKFKRWAVGPIASRVVSGPPPRKSTAKSGGKSKTKSGSGYRYGS